MKFIRKNFASLKPEDINETTLIIDAARGNYPWLNSEVAKVIEHIIELAPSEELHQKFQTEKTKLKDQGFTVSQAHYKAFKTTNYEEEFKEQFNKDLVKDLINNEFTGYKTIIFSCWCASNSPCHTDILIDIFNKAIETTEQVTLFETPIIDDTKEPQYTKGIKSNPWTSIINRSKNIISQYNPKFKTETYLGISIRKHIPLLTTKPSPVLYGGIYSLPINEPNPKSIGRVDINGNYIKCTPKQTGMNKNRSAKQRTKFLLEYEPSEDSLTPKPRKQHSDEIYFTEYGLTEIRETFNGGESNQINTRYRDFIKLTSSEKASRDAGRRNI